MKKIVACVLMLLCTLGIVIAQEAEYSRLAIYGGFLPGQVVRGFQKKLITDSLTPTPETASTYCFSIGGAFFPLNNLGIEGGYNFLGSTKAVSSEASKPLAVYDYSFVNLGIVIRYNVVVDSEMTLSLLLSGGGNYTFLSYNSEFTDLLSSYALYDIDPSIGWYAKFMTEYYFASAFFLGVGVLYNNQSATIQVTEKESDGGAVQVPLTIGFPVF